MRIEQAGKNIKYSVAAYGLKMALQFLVRLVFLQTLPIEYLGINGLFTNLLAMLSLAESGVGPAIVYSLYKPLADKDTETVKALMQLFQRAYRWIGVFIITAGIFVLPWLDLFIKDGSIREIHWFYIVFLLNTGVSYFYSYKRNLLVADQKQYISSIYQSGAQIALSLLQMLALTIYPNYLLYIVLMLLVTLCENFAVAKKADAVYPYLQDKTVSRLDSGIKSTIIKNVKAMIAHKIGGMTVFSTANIILSKVVGLAAVGMYSNYYLVISAVNSFANQFFASLTAGIGNLLVLESADRQRKIFRVLEFTVAWQAMLFSCGFYVLLNPLIELWLGKQFLFAPVIVDYLIINFYLIYMRKAVNSFKDAGGLYWNDRYKPLAEAVINLFASLYLTNLYGIIGVIWGGIISTLLTCFWVEPYVLFRNSIDMKLKEYFKDYFKYMALTLLIAVGSKRLYSNLFSDVTWVNFFLGIAFCLCIANAVWIAVFRNSEELSYLRSVAHDKFGLKFL